MIPAHVRHAKAGCLREAANRGGHDTKAFGIALFRALTEQLHAEADTEHRLGQAAQYIHEARIAKHAHARTRGAHARQDNVTRRADRRRVGRERRVGAEALQGKTHRADIRATGIDKNHALHRLPFVLGSSSPSRRIAWRSVRATTLKQPSTMWCAFSPCTLRWRFAPSVSQSEQKKCGTSSVGTSPTRSRGNVPSKTKYGRPDRSSSARAALSSMGSAKPYRPM